MSPNETSYRRVTLCALAGCLVVIAAYAGSGSTAVVEQREFFMLTPGARPMQPAMQAAVYPEMSAAKWQQATAAAAASAALFLGAQSASAGPFTQSEIASLTYEQIKGTGLANTCPRVEAPSDTAKISVGAGYKMKNFCLEPTSFQVLEEKLTKQGLVTEPVNTKVTTRQTYTLTGIEGTLASEGGKLTFREQDGIDYAASTVQMPGGERVPFLFTVKNLVATADGSG